MTTLREIYHMACPCCGNDERLLVTITVARANLTVDGTDADGDHDWSNNSPCGCPLCGQSGVVADFLIDEGETAGVS